MTQNDLLGVLNNVIRPSVEYSSVVYHSLIPEYVSNQLENVHKQALKIIFGAQVDCQALIESGRIETLKARREQNALKFALKAANSVRFGPVWFKETPSTERSVRPTTRNKYLETKCSTERGKNNPIYFLTRLLNEHYRDEQTEQTGN